MIQFITSLLQSVIYSLNYFFLYYYFHKFIYLLFIVLIDLDQMRKDWWISTAPSQIKTIADHYGVYDDLFGDAYFHPILPLDIKYDFGNEEKIATVHRGNILLPSETTNPPTITYDAEPDTLWTLLLTTPDGNFSDRKFEYCHWFMLVNKI